jgi:hypothetical protein
VRYASFKVFAGFGLLLRVGMEVSRAGAWFAIW